MKSYFLKKTLKKTIVFLPGYHSFCLFLRKIKPKSWVWVDRIPVKPGVLVPVHSSVGDFYMSRPERCSIAKKFFWTNGAREPYVDRIALDLFSDLVKKSSVVLDIGANSGLFSLVAARANPDAEIISFDILPESYHILIDNLLLNDMLPVVDHNLIGVGRNGVYRAPFDNISSEMPSNLSTDYNINNCMKIAVPIKTLDDICYPRFVGMKVCIKIDVEGTEVDIFAYGCKTLETIKPDIICEVLCSSREYENYDQLLDNYSYFKYLITERGLVEFNKIVPNEYYKDWFFTVSKQN